ncbi:MAG: response regulator [Anaerolineales bacterium]|jgi:CheY-like chemotaxis protein
MVDENKGSQSNSGRRPVRVLVVDDEIAFCDVVCEILIASGYVASAAQDAPEAMDALSRERPDLILSDIMMPEIDGLQFIRGLRQDPRFMEIPVLVVSAKASNGDREAAFAAGASSFLAKPFSAGELETHIASLLQI